MHRSVILRGVRSHKQKDGKGRAMKKIITVSMDDLIEHNLEGFLELSERLCGDRVLMDIQYRPVAVVDGMIQVEITASEYSEMME